MTRPYIKLCMAMSLDGKISTVDQSGAHFSSAADKQRLLDLRTQTDAILVGARTIRVDDDRMRVWTEEARQKRLKLGLEPQPICAIVSARGSVPVDAAVFQDPDVPTLVFTTEQMGDEKRDALEKHATIHSVGVTEIDFHEVLRILSEQYRVRHVLAEGGGRLNFALFHEDLVDEIYLTLCPYILGGEDAPTVAEGEGFPFSDIRRFCLIDFEQVGQELFLHYGVCAP